MSENILEAKNISKRYVGVQALKDVSVTIKKGEIKCLAGENGCGKSTFVKIIAGVETPTSGKIFINGKNCTKQNAIGAINEGVQIIYQDLSLFTHMSVAENIVINKLVKENIKFVSKKQMEEVANKALELIDVSMPLDIAVQELSIANRQLVAICRALTMDAKILFMDEPTTALTGKEVNRLLDIVLNLKKKGISVVFISHKLDEVLKVSDSITVLRDGQLVGNFDTKEVDGKKLAYYMTGKDVIYSKYIRCSKDNKPLLSIKELTKIGNYEDISFDIRKGDIVGLTGLLGAGRTELALSLFGLNIPDSGTLIIEDKEVQIKSPWEAVAQGIALVPEDRATQGLFLEKGVNENIIASILDRMQTKTRSINSAATEKLSRECIDKFRIKTHKTSTVVRTLSGGNQQKVVISKWDASKPKIFILDTPTVGVDIGSKAEIYNHIQSFAKSGVGVIIISDEIEEIVANCNRVLIMFHGKKIKEYTEEEMKMPNISKQISSLVESGVIKEEGCDEEVKNR